MAEALTALMKPLEVRVSDRQLASLLHEGLPTFTRLLVVKEVREEESGAKVCFQQGVEGRLDSHDASYSTYVQLARRSQERQHPIGVAFAEGPAITELFRADNDVPTELREKESDGALVLFQGHDGAFRIKPDHPDFARLHALLSDAIRHKARVWFIARKSDLALLDVLPIEEYQISFVVAPDHLLKAANEILQKNIRCAKALRDDIRAVAKAYLDEADELNRAVHEIQTNAATVQIQTLSPPDLIEKAKRLRNIQLTNKEMQENVRKVADSYVLIAEKNHRLFEEFKEKYRHKL